MLWDKLRIWNQCLYHGTDDIACLGSDNGIRSYLDYGTATKLVNKIKLNVSNVTCCNYVVII